ncbi:glycosyltransferase family 2 protein [Angustibacter sp. Root456]|uniref:glycosyltransferase family 2 protein n=1 Tax=Angustibacter sp. Root456 TaxID=1736539 RepID=UPI00138F4A73|nr:glycosyltransferase family 2 protein [Angustibacter sp. Root456]
MKVSVVVAVYNTGERLRALVDSLGEQQHLGEGELEVVLVDDGSSDDTPALLQELARTRADVHVHTIENSGWPGRPRNVGLAHAQGDYVFFADHDDEFFPDALGRMHAMATADRADVVYGKVVRVGARTPYWRLARRDVHGADLVDDHLLDSRSTHKLYRRQFLLDHGVRFLEGKVRLEDHHFMGQVLSHSPRVSVLASQPCYRWIHRSDGTNTSARRPDLTEYFHYFTESVQLLQTPQVPERVRRAIAVVGVDRMLLPVRPRAWAAMPVAERGTTTALLRRFVERCVPRDVDPQLPALKRAVVRALRTGDDAAFEKVLQVRAALRLRHRLEHVAWDDGAVRLRVRGTLTDRTGQPVVVADAGTGPVLAAGPLADVVDALPAWDALGQLEVTVRHRGTGIEWPLPCTSEPVRPAGASGPLEVACTATIDPAHGWFGQSLEVGGWQLLVRSDLLGEGRTQDLQVDDSVAVPEQEEPLGDRAAALRADGTGRLALSIGAPGHSRRPDRPYALRALRWHRGRFVVDVDGPQAPESGATVVLRRRADGGQTEAPLRAGRARLRLPPGRRGDLLDLYVRSRLDDDAQHEHRMAFGRAQVSDGGPARAYETAHGSASLRQLGPQPSWPERALRRLRRARARLGW